MTNAFKGRNKTLIRIDGPGKHFCDHSCKGTCLCKKSFTSIVQSLKDNSEEQVSIIMHNVSEKENKKEISFIIKKDNLFAFKNYFKDKSVEQIKKEIMHNEMFHEMATKNAISIANYVLDKKYVNIDVKNADGFTALQNAVISGNSEFVAMLIVRNANVNELDPEYYLNSMYLALKNKKYDIALTLLNNGANAFEKDPEDRWNYCDEKIIKNMRVSKEQGAKNFIFMLDKMEKPQL